MDSNHNKLYQKQSYYRYTKGQIAERVGFEPTDQFPDLLISSQVQ